MPRFSPRSLFGVLVTITLACGGSGDGPVGPGPGPGPNPAPSGNTVTLGPVSFSPASVTIQTGGAVTWNNTSGVTHNVTFAAATGAPQNIPDHATGSNSRTFNTRGTFGYRCTLHFGMDGSISVQ